MTILRRSSLRKELRELQLKEQPQQRNLLERNKTQMTKMMMKTTKKKRSLMMRRSLKYLKQRRELQRQRPLVTLVPKNCSLETFPFLPLKTLLENSLANTEPL